MKYFLLSIIFSLFFCLPALADEEGEFRITIQGEANMQFSDNGQSATLTCPNFGICATVGCDNCTDPFNFGGDVWIDVNGHGRWWIVPGQDTGAQNTGDTDQEGNDIYTINNAELTLTP